MDTNCKVHMATMIPSEIEEVGTETEFVGEWPSQSGLLGY